MLSSFSELFTPLAIQVGLICLASQSFLYLFFSSNGFGLLGAGPWADMPGMTAHQVVVFPLLAYLTYQGTMDWLFSQGSLEATTPQDRILGAEAHPLAEAVLGMMAFWDVPTGLLTPALREPAMVAHHLAMLATAALALGAFSSNGQPILGYYAPFYFGFVELSSLPLIVVNMFHPKHKAWHAYLKDGPEWLHTVNAVARVLFAVSFMAVRAVYFTHVSVTCVLSDIYHVISEMGDTDDIPVTALVAMGVSNVFFSALQLYWGTLVAQQIVKAMRGAEESKKKKE